MCHSSFWFTTYESELLFFFQPKKYQRSEPHREKALSYFDRYYKVVYGDKWPSLRISLLSRQKYCALVNNFSDFEQTAKKLAEAGGINMIETAKTSSPCELTQKKFTKVGRNSQELPQSGFGSEDKQSFVTESYSNIPGVLTPDSNLHAFMPPKRILSEKEQDQQTEHEEGIYQPKEMNVALEPGAPLKLPEHLKAFVHDRGEVGVFPEIKMHSTGTLCE